MNELIIGQRRQGKSTRALTGAGAKSDFIVVWDPNWNYRAPGIVPVTSAAHLKQLLEADEKRLGKPFVCRIGPFDGPDIDVAFSVYSAVLWDYDGYTLIVDESHMLQGPRKKHDALDRFLRRSPPDTHIIQTSHRLMELNNLSRFLCDDLILFRNEQASELDLIEDQYNIPREEVRTLGNREYCHWYRGPEGRAGYYIQRDSRAWYIDLRNPNRQHGGPGDAGK